MSWVQILFHFDLIFVYGIREWSSFILLQVAIQFSQSHLLERRFHITHACVPRCRFTDHTWVGLLLGSLSFPLIYMPATVPVPYSFNYCSFVAKAVAIKVWEYNSSSFILPPRDCFGWEFPHVQWLGFGAGTGARVQSWVGEGRPCEPLGTGKKIKFRKIKRLLWFFEVFCGSIHIFRLFFLVMWKMPLIFW